MDLKWCMLQTATCHQAHLCPGLLVHYLEATKCSSSFSIIIATNSHQLVWWVWLGRGQEAHTPHSPPPPPGQGLGSRRLRGRGEATPDWPARMAVGRGGQDGREDMQVLQPNYPSLSKNAYTHVPWLMGRLMASAQNNRATTGMAVNAQVGLKCGIIIYTQRPTGANRQSI